MVVRVSDKKQTYNNVTKLLVKPCFNLCITLCISIFIAHQIVGVGIGTVIAVLGVGRVIALCHHIFESKIEELICE